ncbi:hypothetical protein pb186bvf_017547 [Paramecium bursaria]
MNYCYMNQNYIEQKQKIYNISFWQNVGNFHIKEIFNIGCNEDLILNNFFSQKILDNFLMIKHFQPLQP